MKKVYLLVECNVDEYPEVDQAKAADGAKDRVEAALINDCDQLSGPVEDQPWFDAGNGGMTVSNVSVVSNFTVNRINEDEKVKERLVRAQQVIDESIGAWKEILEKGI